MSDLLHDVMVVELGTFITGPCAAMLLAELGADVVKVEQPGAGDPFRNYRGGLYSPQFQAYNARKKSISLNLTDPSAREVLGRLLERADVLIDNYRPGVLGKFGLAAEQVAAQFPRLIYCSITGFGERSPYAGRPCYDTVAQALSGYLSQFVDPDEPHIAGPAVADALTGMYAAQAILGALFDRARGGNARRIEIAMLDAMIAFTAEPFASLFATGVPPAPRTRPSISQSYVVVCADGKAIALHLASLEKFWRGLLQALGEPQLEHDQRFATRELRVANYEALHKALGAVFAREPRARWIERLVERDVPHAPVATLDEVQNDPHVREACLIETAAHPLFGEVKAVRRPAVIDGSRGAPLQPAPALGEHTATLLANLGYLPETIAAMRTAGAIY